MFHIILNIFNICGGILHHPEEEEFVNVTVERLLNELDTIIYFGISHQKLLPPKPTNGECCFLLVLLFLS